MSRRTVAASENSGKSAAAFWQVCLGLLTLATLGAGGCAAPRFDVHQQTFVTDSEIAAARLMDESLSHFSRGQFIDAELKLRLIRYRFPKTRNISLNLAQVLLRNDQEEEAGKLYADLFRAYPNSTEILNHAARSYYDAEKLERARDLYEQVLVRARAATENTDSGENKLRTADRALLLPTMRTLAVIYFRMGDEHAALCMSQDSLDGDVSLEALIRHARLLIGLQRYSSAETMLQGYQVLHPEEKEPRFKHLLALTLFARGDLAGAVEQSRTAYERKEQAPAFDAEITVVNFILEEEFRKLTPAGPNAEEAELENEGNGEDSGDRVLTAETFLYLPPTLVKLHQERELALELAEEE